MANKKQSWSKMVDSFDYDTEHDVSPQERDEFIDASRREEIAKAAKAPSLDKFMNPGLTTKILARLGFKGAVEKVQLYHEAKSERIEQERITKEAAKATRQAAEAQTAEALAQEQGLSNYATAALADRSAASTADGQAWMAQYFEAGQKAVKKLEENKKEFDALVEAQGVAIEKSVASQKQAEQSRAYQTEVAEREAEREAEKEAGQVESRFLDEMDAPAEEITNTLQQSMVEGEPGYDPNLESTTKSDLTELTDGIEGFVDSKAGFKLEEKNPELVDAMTLAAKETNELLGDIDETIDQTSKFRDLLKADEVTQESEDGMSAMIAQITSLEVRINKISRLLDAPEGIIDQLDAIKRPSKDMKQLKEYLANASARLIKLQEIKAFKQELKKKLPEAVAFIASRTDTAELPEQNPEQHVSEQIQETLKEAEQSLERNQDIMNQLSEHGGDLLESDERKPIIVMVPIAMNRIRNLSSASLEVSFMMQAANEQVAALKQRLESKKIDKKTVVGLGDVISAVGIVEQTVNNLKQELGQEHNAAELLTHVKNPGELTKQYQDTLEQAKEAGGDTDELDQLKNKFTEQLGQTIGLLAKKAGEDKDKMAWTRKMVDWSKEASKPMKAEVHIDEDELDEQLMAEIDAQIKKEVALERLLAERRGTEYGEQPEIDEAELEAMEKIAKQKYEFGDRVFVETLGLKLGGEVKAYTEDGQVEVRFDDGKRQTFNQDKLQPEPASERPKAKKKPVRLLSKEEQAAGVEGVDPDESYQAVEDVGDVPTTIKRRKKFKPEDIDKQLTA